MTPLQPGANTAVPSDALTITLKLEPASVANLAVDISAFLLAENGKVRGDQDMVFYGQTRNANGSVHLAESSAGQARFTVNLPDIEAALEKIAFTATIDENRQPFAAFRSIELTLQQGSTPIASARIATEGMKETALILGEFYRRQGAWKFRVVGQGFAGGLQPLAEHFGVEISEPAAPPPPPPKVSLSKITLDKTRPTVSLEKRGGLSGAIRINLNWSRLPIPKDNQPLNLNQNARIDLDLGCLFELTDGRKGVVQALGNAFGSFQSLPFIELSGDDRTGDVAEGEWLRINADMWQHLRRIIVYAYIYEGVPNWGATDGVVTVYAPDEPPIEIRLSEGNNRMGMCGIVLLENAGGKMNISREVRYFTDHRDLDIAYRWGMRWQVGAKE